MGKNSQYKKTILGRSSLKTKIAREFSSGGVVYRKVKTQGSKVKIVWLLAASMPSDLFPKPSWRLPKGWIDDEGVDIPGPMASGKIRATEESLMTAALREVKEEGGVEAKIISKIGSQTFFYTHPLRGKILKFVTFYLMEWQKDLPEGFDGETSEISWLPYEEAYQKLSFEREKEMLQKANDLFLKI